MGFNNTRTTKDKLVVLQRKYDELMNENNQLRHGVVNGMWTDSLYKSKESSDTLLYKDYEILAKEWKQLNLSLFEFLYDVQRMEEQSITEVDFESIISRARRLDTQTIFFNMRMKEINPHNE